MRYILLFLSFLILISCTETPMSQWQDPPITGTPSYKAWGIHQIQNGKNSFGDGIVAQLEQLGSGATYVATFTDLPYPISAERIAEVHTLQLIPVISFEPSKTWHGTSQNELEGILSGYWDSTLTRWATSIAALDDTVIVRFGYEMNGDWFAYGQQPESFIECWIYTYTLFQNAGAHNVLWMFAPNVEWDKNKPLTDFSLYYPGDSVVDLLGLDGYNFGDNHDIYHYWQSYSEVFEPSISKISRYNKPLILSEIGCADGERQYSWIDDFLIRISRDSRVSGFIYFNQHTSYKNEPDWCLTCNEEALELFNQWTIYNNRLNE